MPGPSLRRRTLSCDRTGSNRVSDNGFANDVADGSVLDDFLALYSGRCRRVLQAICRRGVALPIHHPFDGEPNGFGWAHQDRKLLGSSESGVQQISTQEQIVLYEQGKYNGWVLTPLTFVDSDSPRKCEFREVCIIVGHRPLRKLDDNLLFLQVNRSDHADIPIEDFPLVVVDLLDHPVTHPQDAASACQLHFSRLRWVEDLLEHRVELSRSRLSACCRAEHLYLLQRIDAVLGKELAHQVADAFCPSAGSAASSQMQSDSANFVVGVKRGNWPVLMRWALVTMWLSAAWRNTSVSRTTGTCLDSIRSRRTIPGPTLGNWSISP